MKNESSPSKITLKQARRVLEVVDAGLSSGLGRPKLGEMCVEAAVCYALGQPHGDEPECVNSAVRAFKINLNDQNWSSKAARALGMRKIAIAQLGTKSDDFDQKKFLEELSRQTIIQVVPIALRAAAGMTGNEKHKDALEAAAIRCEKEGTEAATAATATAAAAAANYAAANYDDDDDAAAATTAAAAAAAAANYAATAAYYAANYATAANYAASRTRDKIFTLCAEIGVQALRAAGAAGIALMDKLIK